ncbi:transmembrane protein 181-like [Liolophura sinensis]|uniref:transmembrane protein 181-like n=1 Tax=Liolophura sinensis TaxID=3198878 RepID=UPI0031593C57
MDGFTESFSDGAGCSLSLRAGLSQFSDVFSAFGNYIAPTYHHDRCERSVQMRLYALNKRHFVVVFAAFFISFGISVLIGLAGPPIITTVSKNVSGIVKNYKTGPFELKSPSLSRFHQQLWLIAHVDADISAGTKFEHKFDISMLVRGVNGEEEPSFSTTYMTQTYHNRSRILRCEKTCDDLILLHLGYLDYTNYIINIHFYGLENIRFDIKNVQFSFKSYNTGFTQLEIWMRFVFLVLTFLATCIFAHSLRKFSVRDWSIEQKWMSVLLPLLLLYNDPIFPLTFLINSWVPGILDAIFQATFLCALLLFWLCIYHGVRQTERRFVVFYLPKLCIVGLIWLCAVTLSSWQEYNELRDPTYYYRLDTANFMGFKVFFFIIGGLYLLYLVYLLVRAYAELRSMPYFDLRLKFLTALMLIVLSISIAITVIRFGGAMLEDNFVSEISTNYQNSVEFVSFYGLLNFYLYTMAFVYSPSRNALYESHFKDNPALSMLNDSDEEVHYGSDHEETALTSTQIHRYESD